MAKAIGIAHNNVTAGMRFRTHRWLDLSTMRDKFSVQASPSPRKWAHIYDHKGIIFHRTKERAEQAIERYKSGDEA